MPARGKDRAMIEGGVGPGRRDRSSRSRRSRRRTEMLTAACFTMFTRSWSDCLRKYRGGSRWEAEFDIPVLVSRFRGVDTAHFCDPLSQLLESGEIAVDRPYANIRVDMGVDSRTPPLLGTD